ncbi:MAG: hypothetical protein RL632_456 [Bacteroidota bacterium]
MANSLSHMLRFTCKTLVLSVALLGMNACENTDETKEASTVKLDEDYYEFRGISLQQYDIPAMIMLPDETANIGASTRPEVKHPDSFIWSITLGAKFMLFIEDFGDYRNRVSNKKKELKEQTMFKIQYLYQSSDLIVYERTLIVRGSKQASPSVGVEHKSYHVYGQKIIDGITYELRSKDEGCSRNIAVLMAKSIKSFKALENR